MPVIYIGDGADNFRFGASDEDLMFGLGGEDELYGGSGNDQLVGGNGDDDLYGGSGHDEIWGQNDNDDLFGGLGRDMLAGGNGNDALIGGAHADRLYGEAGNDTITYDALDVVMDGGADEDTLLVSTGDITLGLGNVENMEIINLASFFGTSNELHGTGSFTEFVAGSAPVTHTNLLTPDNVSMATDGRNTLDVSGDPDVGMGPVDKVLLDTDWTWSHVNGDSQNVFIGTDSASNTVTLEIDLNVAYEIA